MRILLDAHVWYGFEWFGISVADWAISIAAIIGSYYAVKGYYKLISDDENQQRQINKQQFENTFFNMINLYNQIVTAIDIRKKRRKQFGNIRARVEASIMGDDTDEINIQGRDCFVVFYDGFTNEYEKTVKGKGNGTEKIINEAFTNYYMRHQSDLGHYFRMLYQIFKFIDNADVENKKQYSSLLRAQLSSHELLLLFYNGLSNNGKKFKPLIETYQLLDNMPKGDLLNITHQSLYNPSAY